MSRIALFAVLAAAAIPSPALAQPETVDPNADSATAPDSPACVDAFFQQELDDAKARSRRSRNALIGTSAAVGVGLAFIPIGNSQCQVVSRPGQEDTLLCNTTGDVLWGLGVSMMVTGGIGMITSAIILGVANKRVRQTKRDIRSRHYSRKVRWDAPSGGFTF
ncbi:MAG: hypothetical protein WBM74_10160 [Polyangiales bacterium]